MDKDEANEELAAKAEFSSQEIEIGSISVHLTKKDYIKLFGLVVAAHATTYVLITAAIAFNERQAANVQQAS